MKDLTNLQIERKIAETLANIQQCFFERTVFLNCRETLNETIRLIEKQKEECDRKAINWERKKAGAESELALLKTELESRTKISQL